MWSPTTSGAGMDLFSSENPMGSYESHESGGSRRSQQGALLASCPPESIFQLNSDVFSEIFSYFTAQELRFVLANVNSIFRDIAMDDRTWEYQFRSRYTRGLYNVDLSNPSDGMLSLLQFIDDPLVGTSLKAEMELHTIAQQRLRRRQQDISKGRARLEALLEGMPLATDDGEETDSLRWFDVYVATQIAKAYVPRLKQSMQTPASHKVWPYINMYHTLTELTLWRSSTLLNFVGLVPFADKAIPNFDHHDYPVVSPGDQREVVLNAGPLVDLITLEQIKQEVEKAHGRFATPRYEVFGTYLVSGFVIEVFINPVWYAFTLSDSSSLNTSLIAARPWFNIQPIKFIVYLLTLPRVAAGKLLQGWLPNWLSLSSGPFVIPFVDGNWYDAVFTPGQLEVGAMVPWLATCGTVAVGAALLRDKVALNPFWWARHGTWTHPHVWLHIAGEELFWQLAARSFISGCMHVAPYVAMLPSICQSRLVIDGIPLLLASAWTYRFVQSRRKSYLTFSIKRADVALGVAALAFRYLPKGSIEGAMRQAAVFVVNTLTNGVLSERLQHLDLSRSEGAALCGIVVGSVLASILRIAAVWDSTWKANCPTTGKTITMGEVADALQLLPLVDGDTFGNIYPRVNTMIAQAWHGLQGIRASIRSTLLSGDRTSLRVQQREEARIRARVKDGKATPREERQFKAMMRDQGRATVQLDNLENACKGGPHEMHSVSRALNEVEEKARSRWNFTSRRRRVAFGIALIVAEVAINVGSVGVLLSTGRYWETILFRVAVGLATLAPSYLASKF